MSLFDHLSAHRRFVSLVIALLTAGGVAAGLRLPSAIYPELYFSRITIVARGSSLGTRQVVFSVTRPIEEAVSVVPGVTRVHSRSIRGASEITVTFTPRTDMLYALQLVQARINEVRGDLPAGLDIEAERLTPSLFPILSYNLEGGDAATLYDIARYQVRPVISRIPGVGRVDIEGTDVREIEVVCDPARLAAQGLSYDDVAAAIRQATSVDAVGRLEQNYRQLLVVTDQEAHTTEDIGNIVVTTAAGPGVRVRDLGTVATGTEDHTHIVAGDGRPRRRSTSRGNSAPARSPSRTAWPASCGRSHGPCHLGCGSKPSTTRRRWCGTRWRPCVTPCSSAQCLPPWCCCCFCVTGR